jgi:hypothetical protein
MSANTPFEIGLQREAKAPRPARELMSERFRAALMIDELGGWGLDIVDAKASRAWGVHEGTTHAGLSSNDRDRGSGSTTNRPPPG